MFNGELGIILGETPSLVSAALGATALFMASRNLHNKQRAAAAEARADRDEMTALYSRAYVLKAYEQLRGQHYSRGRRLTDIGQTDWHIHSLILIDVDNFKRINTLLGHSGGNVALKQVSATMRENTRAVDIPFRFGGGADEFGVLLPGTDLGAAQHVAEKLRTDIEKGDNDLLRISLAVGELNLAYPWEDNYDYLDTALDQAKHAGRNQVVSVGPLFSGPKSR